MSQIIIERSHRHVHLTARTAEILFGDQGLHLTPLSVLGQYATDLYVHVPCLGKTRVLYPWRPYNQLEVSMSEYLRMIGHYTKRRESGDVGEAETVEIESCVKGSKATIPVIVPSAHVHTPDLSILEALEEFQLGLEVRFAPTLDGNAYVHLDNDQFNAVIDFDLPVQWRF